MKLCKFKNCTHRCCRLHWINRKFDNVPLFDMTADPMCKRKKGSEQMVDLYDAKKNCQVQCLETKKVFKDSEEAAIKIGASASRIRKCCRGEIATAGGFTWTYIE